MTGSPDVTIVGAGIIGSACALFLARAGARVTVVERGHPGCGTSGACEGNLLAWDKEPEHELALYQRSRVLWEELAGELEDFEFDPKGSIAVAETEAELEAVARLAKRLRDRGIASDVLDATSLRSEEPTLAQDLAGGVLFPKDAQVEPRRATVSLLREARRLGARVVTGATVRPLADHGEVELQSGERISTGRVVLAAGVWTPQLLSALQEVELPVLPRKGQIVVGEGTPRPFRRKLNEASYLTAVGTSDHGVQVAMVAESTRAGTTLLGSSRELAGYDTRVDTAVAGRIAARTLRFFPALRSLRALRIYAGLRAFTPDHLPVIGEATQDCFVATGHEGAGIGLAPATGEAIAALVTGAPTPVACAAFSPARFGR